MSLPQGCRRRRCAAFLLLLPRLTHPCPWAWSQPFVRMSGLACRTWAAVAGLVRHRCDPQLALLAVLRSQLAPATSSRWTYGTAWRHCCCTTRQAGTAGQTGQPCRSCGAPKTLSAQGPPRCRLARLALRQQQLQSSCHAPPVPLRKRKGTFTHSHAAGVVPRVQRGADGRQVFRAHSAGPRHRRGQPAG